MILEIKPIAESSKINTSEDYSNCRTFMEAAMQATYEYEENWRRFDNYFSENHIILDENHINFLMENGINVYFEAEEAKKISGNIVSILKSWADKVKGVLNKFKEDAVKSLDVGERIKKLETSVEEIKWPEGKTIKATDFNSIKPFYPKLISEEIGKKGLKSMAKWNGTEWTIDETVIKRHVKEWSGKDQETCSIMDILTNLLGGKMEPVAISGSTKGYSYKEARTAIFNDLPKEIQRISDIEKSINEYQQKLGTELSHLIVDEDKDNAKKYNSGIPKIQKFLKAAASVDMTAIYAACDIWAGKFELNKQVCLAYLSGPQEKSF